MYTKGRCTPQMNLAEKFSYSKRVFDPKYVKFQLSSFNSFQDMRVVSNLHKGRCAPQTPPCEKFLTPKKSILLYLCMRKILTFYL